MSQNQYCEERCQECKSEHCFGIPKHLHNHHVCFECNAKPKAMENSIFFQKFHVTSILNFIKKELVTDYERLIENCRREAQGNSVRVGVLKAKNVANMSDEEIELEIARLEGQSEAYHRMMDYIADRIW